MKTTQPSFMPDYRSRALRFLRNLSILAGLILSIPTPSEAAVIGVTGGQAIINYDESAFTPGYYENMAFFNQGSNSTPYASIVAGTWDPNVWTLPGDTRGWTGLVHNVNGSSVTSPAQRYIQATNFSYDPSDITGTATGQIGLGGLARLEYYSEVSSGSLLFGDFALFYNTLDAQWQLKCTIAGFEYFAITHFFEIRDTILTPTETGFTLQGDLYITDEMFGIIGDFYQVRKEGGAFVSSGDIFVHVEAIPEPSSIMLISVAAGGLLVFARNRRKLGC